MLQPQAHRGQKWKKSSFEVEKECREGSVPKGMNVFNSFMFHCLCLMALKTQFFKTSKQPFLTCFVTSSIYSIHTVASTDRHQSFGKISVANVSFIIQFDLSLIKFFSHPHCLSYKVYIPSLYQDNSKNISKCLELILFF